MKKPTNPSAIKKKIVSLQYKSPLKSRLFGDFVTRLLPLTCKWWAFLFNINEL
jgi:hypothetical protein